METIRSEGLGAKDFSYNVEITWGETRLYFNYAFCLVDEAKGLAAVFTEHDGYHVFPLYGAAIYNVRKEWVYTWSEE